MWKWLIVLALVVVIGGCSQEAEARGWDGDICDSPFGKIMNECVEHPANPSVDKEAVPIGVGMDLILWESDVKGITYKVTTEYKYDLMNSNHSVYTVLTLRVWDFINKIGE